METDLVTDGLASVWLAGIRVSRGTPLPTTFADPWLFSFLLSFLFFSGAGR